MRPITIPPFVLEHLKPGRLFEQEIDQIKERIGRLRKGPIQVTVSIPAYNEAANILRTLSSLSFTESDQSVEILVVDNNSSDATAALAQAAGATVIVEKKQGVQNARTAGLHAAAGTIVINADADSIYTPNWVNRLSSPLADPSIALAYGRFAFFSEQGEARLPYFFYETMSDPYKWWLAKTKEEAMFVYGCSSCYRKAQAIAVNGFEHPPGTNEDGYLGYKLRTRFGKLFKVHDNDALVWTSNRRLVEGGGLLASFQKRFFKAFTQKIDTSNLEEGMKQQGPI